MLEEFLGKSLQKIILTLPSYFDENQRKALIESAHMAKLTDIKLLENPLALCISREVSIQEDLKNIKRFVVLELNSNFFQISLVEKDGKRFKELKRKMSDYSLNGKAFINNFIQICEEQLYKRHNINLKENWRAYTR